MAKTGPEAPPGQLRWQSRNRPCHLKRPAQLGGTFPGHDALSPDNVDLLSSAIDAMRTGRPSASRLRVGASWCYQFAPYDGAGFHVLLRGTGWLIPEIAQPVRLSAGDVALLPHGRPHVLSRPSSCAASATWTVLWPIRCSPGCRR